LIPFSISFIGKGWPITPVLAAVELLLGEVTDARLLRLVQSISLRQVVTLPQSPAVYGPVYAVAQTALSTLFFDFRTMFNPPVTGAGFTIAVLDSGIRKTHLGLKDKLVYEVNLSDAPSAEDVFDHGTGVAYIAAGGKHGVGEDSGMAPGARLMNIKVINDNG